MHRISFSKRLVQLFASETGSSHGRAVITVIAGLALTTIGAWQASAQRALPDGHPGKDAGPRLGTISKVEITTTNRADVEWLVRAGFDLDSVKGDRIIIYADSDELSALQTEGWTMTVMPAPSPSGPGTKNLGAYNNYTNMTAMLSGFATNYPSLCRKSSIGKSVQGRDLWVLKVTSNPDIAADKPRFTYIATMHANEPIGTEMSLYLIDLLLQGYTTNDSRIVNLLNNVEIWFLPLMNPDGRESNPPQRYNANGYDLNRSFPEGSGTNFGNQLYGPIMATNGLQPEVAEVMAWTSAHHFTLSANYHSGALVANYPYDNDNMGSVNSPTPDDALAQALSLAYSSNNPPMWASATFPNGIVNGAYWYAITGGMQDWNYRYDGDFQLTIELADYQWPDPPASELATYWSQNRESMLTYIEWSLKGVRGIMNDAVSGQPIKGAVRIEGYPHLVFSNPTLGDYHRLLLPGTYALWFYAPGYIAQRIPNVVVGTGTATRLDISLQPVSSRFAAKINFQTASAIIPTGFRADTGASFGARAGGYTYGWEITLPAANLLERHAGQSQDLRYDTLCQMQSGGNHVWEIAVPNGPYSVLVTAGDPNYATGTYRIAAEGTVLLDGVPTPSNRWVEALGTVTVTDGRLTLSSASGSASNRLAAVEISAIEPATITQWRALYFGTTNNAGSSADGADPDADGIPNLLEYALGLNPTNANSRSQLSPVFVSTNNTMWFGGAFRRNTNASDLTFRVQGASGLYNASWADIASRTNTSGWVGFAPVSESGTNPVIVTVLDPEPIANGTNRLLRLRVSSP
jgi:carboxypeptidase D